MLKTCFSSSRLLSIFPGRSLFLCAFSSRVLKPFFHTAYPVVLKSPQNKTVVEGQNITMTCSAKGHPRPSVAWFTNGIRQVSYSTSARSITEKANEITETTSSFLTITSANHGRDDGLYFCEFSNSAGRKSSSDGKVTVHGKQRYRFMLANQSTCIFVRRDEVKSLLMSFACRKSEFQNHSLVLWRRLSGHGEVATQTTLSVTVPLFLTFLTSTFPSVFILLNVLLWFGFFFELLENLEMKNTRKLP